MPISDGSKKKCKVCLLIKPINEFRKWRNTCKKCEYKQSVQYKKAAKLRKKQTKEILDAQKRNSVENERHLIDVKNKVLMLCSLYFFADSRSQPSIRLTM